MERPGPFVPTAWRRLALRRLAVPLLVAAAVHAVLVFFAAVLPITAGIDFREFRRDIARRFNILDIQRVKETELVASRKQKVVTIDPAEIVRTLTEILDSLDLARPAVSLASASDAAPAGPTETAAAPADAGFAARGLSEQALAAAGRASLLTDRIATVRKPRAISAPAVLAIADRTFAAAIEDRPTPPPPAEGPVLIDAEATPPTFAAALLAPQDAPLAAQPDFAREPLRALGPGSRKIENAIELAAAPAAAASPGDPNVCFSIALSPRDPGQLPPMPKDVVFLVDVTSTVPDAKLEQVRQALNQYLPGLRPDDRFNVFTFGADAQRVFPESVAASPENIAKAVAAVAKLPNEMKADLVGALRTVCKSLPGSNRPSNVFVVHDCRSQQPERDARKIISSVLPVLPDAACICTFDAGPGGNRFLLEFAAWAGRGAAAIAPQIENSAHELVRVARAFDSPLLAPVRVLVAGPPPEAQAVRRVPNLFAGEPLVLHGPVAAPASGDGSGSVAVLVAGFGLAGPRSAYAKVELAKPDPAHPTDASKKLMQDWARERIHGLVARMALKGDDQEAAQEIRDLGQRFGVPTPYPN